MSKRNRTALAPCYKARKTLSDSLPSDAKAPNVLLGRHTHVARRHGTAQKVIRTDHERSASGHWRQRHVGRRAQEVGCREALATARRRAHAMQERRYGAGTCMLESLTRVHKKLVGVESRLKRHPTVGPIRCHRAEHRPNQTELIRISTDLAPLLCISTDLAPLLCILSSMYGRCRSIGSSMRRQSLCDCMLIASLIRSSMRRQSLKQRQT